MTPIMLELLFGALWDTILMTVASGLISLVAGLPLGLALVPPTRAALPKISG
jgi:D-methionine transport system permease protein